MSSDRTSSLPSRAVAELRKAETRVSRTPALIGFDGFVDTILHVVAKRESASKYTPFTRMKDWGTRVSAAAGLSANFELAPQLVKIGGNGPIMANALSTFGLPITYIGNLGSPAIHPVFRDFAKRATVYSVAEPGYTDALEFQDGKLMLGKHSSLPQVNWKSIIATVGEAPLRAAFQSASLVALVNWTMLPHMSAIFSKILSDIAPGLSGPPRRIFFDLADPAKRTPADVAKALRLIAQFQKFFDVILGLNLHESELIGKTLGLKLSSAEPPKVEAHARRLVEKLSLAAVIIHPTQFAAGATASECAHVHGPYTAKPRITTGGGDHFNAGFCLGQILDAPLDVCLQMAVATSGCYVRSGKSPTLPMLRRFLAGLMTTQQTAPAGARPQTVP